MRCALSFAILAVVVVSAPMWAPTGRTAATPNVSIGRADLFHPVAVGSFMVVEGGYSAVVLPSSSPAATVQPTASQAPEPSPAPGFDIPGVASWYRWRVGEGAAGPALRRALGKHWRGKVVRVCRLSTCIRVRLTDSCGCPGRRVVDLDRRSFARLGVDPSVGLVRVHVYADR